VPNSTCRLGFVMNRTIHHTNQTGTGSSCPKLRKPDCPVWQIGWSGFIDSDGSQGRRRHSTRELLLWSSDVWKEDRQEPRQPKGLKRQILDLIYEKKENLIN
jgi:hypothetical protein